MLLRLTTLAIALLLSTTASAGIIFEDDFDADTIGIPQGTLINWDINSGTVDVVGSSSFGYLCNNSTAGYCLDLDGTPGNATIVTKSAFNLAAGDYEFSFDYGNNFGTGNVLYWGIGTVASGYTNAALGSVVSDAVPNDIYWGSTNGFTLGSALNSVYITFIQNGPQDNGGTVLDNVVLNYLGTGTVPEPGSLALLCLGLLGLSARRRQIQSN